MPWLNDKLKRETQRVVKAHCANFNSADNGCLLGGTCRYWHELMPGEEVHRCVWAEEGVLANDPPVEVEYHERLSMYLGTGESANIGTCKKCGRDFVKTSNRNVYCTKCKEEAAREAKTKRQRRYRQNARKKGA